MIVTIDGPAGAGKSTVARALAKRLGFRFLDTGAMYRAVALAALRQGLDWNRPDDLAALAQRVSVVLDADQVLLDGEDVTAAIRAPEVTAATQYAASNPRVREHLVALQRALAAGHNVVAEGRDQGTVAFPAAECKIFLTASAEERARRRVADLAARGESVTLADVLSQQNRRDQSDATRSVGPLARAHDAIEVCSDGLTPDEVLERLESLLRARSQSGA